jgi:hypothetical protein
MPQENVPLSEAASTPVRSESMLRGGRPASSLGPFVPVAAIHARPRRVASEQPGKARLRAPTSRLEAPSRTSR